MNDAGTPTEQFTKELKHLANTFGRTVDRDLLVEFYKIFGAMSPESFGALVEWAVRNLNPPFPSVDRLRKGAVELGFLKADPGKPDGPRARRNVELLFEYVVCPGCEGTFVIFKAKLPEYAREERVFECVNHLYEGCPITFQAVLGEAGPEIRCQNGGEK